MPTSKSKKILNRLYELKDDIANIQSLAEFHGWLSETLSIASTYIKSKDPYNKLLELNKHAVGDASYIDSRVLQSNLRDKAIGLIKGCIRIIESEGIYVEKKSILETMLDTKTLLAFIGVLLTIITTMLVVGLPNSYNRGFNTAKEIFTNGRQNEIELLQHEIDSLNRVVNNLRDSLAYPKIHDE